MQQKSNLIIAAQIGIILILVCILIFKKPVTVVEPFDDTELRQQIAEKDSIAAHWELQANQWKTVASLAEAKSDSLELLKPQIQHHYHEIYTAIADGTVVELDNIIRSNW